MEFSSTKKRIVESNSNGAFYVDEIQIHLGASLPSGIGHLGSMLRADYSNRFLSWLDPDQFRALRPKARRPWQSLGYGFSHWPLYFPQGATELRRRPLDRLRQVPRDSRCTSAWTNGDGPEDETPGAGQTEETKSPAGAARTESAGSVSRWCPVRKFRRCRRVAPGAHAAPGGNGSFFHVRARRTAGGPALD